MKFHNLEDKILINTSAAYLSNANFGIQVFSDAGYNTFLKFPVNSSLYCLHSFRSIHCNIESNDINNSLHKQQRNR